MPGTSKQALAVAAATAALRVVIRAGKAHDGSNSSSAKECSGVPSRGQTAAPSPGPWSQNLHPHPHNSHVFPPLLLESMHAPLPHFPEGLAPGTYAACYAIVLVTSPSPK